MSSVHPKSGGPYTLYCDECGCWIPNTANAEMRKEGVIAYSHFCDNGVCDMRNGEILDSSRKKRRMPLQSVSILGNLSRPAASAPISSRVWRSTLF